MSRLLLVALLLCACSDATSPEDSVVGNYAAISINGSPIPYTYPGTTVRIDSSRIILSNVNGHMEARLMLGVTTPEVWGVFHETGTWTISGNTVTLYDLEDPITLERNGRTLRLVEDDEVWIYRK